MMRVYTVKEAAHVLKIGRDTLRRACKEGYIKAMISPNGQIRISERALEEAMAEGMILKASSKPTKKKKQPEGLRKYAERRQAEKGQSGA